MTLILANLRSWPRLVCIGSEATGQSGAWVDVNGARLYYERSGSGAEVVLILIHEFSLDHLSSRWV